MNAANTNPALTDTIAITIAPIVCAWRDARTNNITRAQARLLRNAGVIADHSRSGVTWRDATVEITTMKEMAAWLRAA